MARHSMCLLAALLLGTAIAGAAAQGISAEDAEPIYTQTFEKKNPTGWTINWNNDTVPADASLRSGQAGHKSDNGVRITVLDPAAATSSVRLTSPEIELEADNFYTFRFNAMSKPKAPLQVVLYLANQTGVSYVTRQVNLLSVWRLVSLTFKPTYSGEYRLMMSYGRNITAEKDGKATLLIDNFKVYDGLFDDDTMRFMSNLDIKEMAERAAFEADQKEMLKNGPTELVIGDGGQLVLQPKSQEQAPKVLDRPAIQGIVSADAARKAASQILSESEEAAAWAVNAEPSEEEDKEREEDDSSSSSKEEDEESSSNEEGEAEETISVDLGSDSEGGDEESEDDGEFAALSDSLLTTEGESLARGSAGAELFSG